MRLVVGLLRLVVFTLGLLLADADLTKDEQLQQVMSQLRLLQDKVQQQGRDNAWHVALAKGQDAKIDALEKSITVLKRANIQQEQSYKKSIQRLEKFRKQQNLEIAELRKKVDQCACESRRKSVKTAHHLKDELAVPTKTNSDKVEIKVGSYVNDTFSPFSHEAIDGLSSPNFLSANSSSLFPHLTPHPRRLIRSDDASPLETSLAQVTQRVDVMTAKMATLEASQQASDARHDAAISAAASSTFVRWGKGSCGDHADIVYRGTVGGSCSNTLEQPSTSSVCRPTLSSAATTATTHTHTYMEVSSRREREPPKTRTRCAPCAGRGFQPPSCCLQPAFAHLPGPSSTPATS